MTTLAMLLVSILICWAVPRVSAAPASGAVRPNVLLITIDTLRPDALGWIGGRNDTPVVDELAASGFGFSQAVSPMPLTQPAHASLFTALNPRRHGVIDNGISLDRGIATLAEVLSSFGYATAAVISGYPLDSAMGLDRGFDHYDDHLSATGGVERDAKTTTDAARRWLESVDSVERPWFLWVHYFDPHDPYEPPDRFAKKGPRGGYDGEVEFVDYSIGRLLDGAQSPTRSLLSVVTSDHGESLGEHHENTHGFFVYQSTVAVPVIFNWPGRVRRGASALPVRLVDLAPTLLELLDLPPLPNALDGISLVPLLDGDSLTLPPAYIEAQRSWLSYGWAPLRAIRVGRWKLIAAPRSELYDLEADPSERQNLLGDQRRRAGELGKQLLAYEESVETPAAARTTSIDPDVVNKLAALGYVSGSIHSSAPDPLSLPDPKDRLSDWQELSVGLRLLENRSYGPAIEVFDRVLEREPINPFALSRSAVALVAIGHRRAAVERLRRMLEIRPEDRESRLLLAESLNALGQPAEAAVEWRVLAKQEPANGVVWANLATSLGQSARFAEAKQALETAIELSPQRVDLVLQMARIELSENNLEAGVRWLLEAAAREPDSFQQNSSLGLALTALRRYEDALPWLRKATSREADFARARLELAVLEARAGRYGAAERALGEAIEADPGLEGLVASHPELQSLTIPRSR